MGKTTVNLEPETPFHTLTVDQVAKHYNTSILEGISSEDATQRLQTYGPNELEGDGGIKWYKVLWRQFANVLVCVLLAACVSRSPSSTLCSRPSRVDDYLCIFP